MTHAPVDWRLRCNVKPEAEHQWHENCAHNADSTTHPYRCCLHRSDRDASLPNCDPTLHRNGKHSLRCYRAAAAWHRVVEVNEHWVLGKDWPLLRVDRFEVNDLRERWYAGGQWLTPDDEGHYSQEPDDEERPAIRNHIHPPGYDHTDDTERDGHVHPPEPAA